MGLEHGHMAFNRLYPRGVMLNDEFNQQSDIECYDRSQLPTFDQLRTIWIRDISFLNRVCIFTISAAFVVLLAELFINSKSRTIVFVKRTMTKLLSQLIKHLMNIVSLIKRNLH